MELFLEIVAAVGPVLLAGTGIGMVFIPKLSRFRWVMVIAFIFVGGATSYATWQTIRSTKIDLKETREAITGGDNYPYLMADLSRAKNLIDPIPLMIVNNGTGPIYDVAYWISPASAGGNDKDPAYRSIDTPHNPIKIVYRGSYLFGRSLPPGHYRIEFTARNGAFIEFLKIVEFKGELIQIIDVIDTKNDQKLYASPRPLGF